MPGVNVGSLVALTLKASFKELSDQIFVSTRTLKFLMSKGIRKEQRGGDFISVPLRYKQNSNVKWMGFTENYSIASQDPYDQAQFDWRLIGGTVPILREYEVKNKGKSQIIDLVQRLKDDVVETMQDVMNEAVFNDGTDNKAPIGLRAIVSTTGTYGSIARSGNTWWQGQVESTTEALSITKMDSQWNLASANRTAPNCIATTRTLLEKYEDLARQFVNINSLRSADLGFEMTKYKSVPMWWDDDCPSTHLYMLNTKYLHMVTDPDNEFRVLDPIKVDQPLEIIPVEWWGALVCSGPRYQALLSNKS